MESIFLSATPQCHDHFLSPCPSDLGGSFNVRVGIWEVLII